MPLCDFAELFVRRRASSSSSIISIIRSCRNGHYFTYSGFFYFAGSCCWALYSRDNFRGRPLFLGGRISMRSVHKMGWRASKIRSARKVDACQMS